MQIVRMTFPPLLKVCCCRMCNVHRWRRHLMSFLPLLQHLTMHCSGGVCARQALFFTPDVKWSISDLRYFLQIRPMRQAQNYSRYNVVLVWISRKSQLNFVLNLAKVKPGTNAATTMEKIFVTIAWKDEQMQIFPMSAIGNTSKVRYSSIILKVPV